MNIHGTKSEPDKHHPVLDIAHWEGEFPLERDSRFDVMVSSPADVAYMEQLRRAARLKGDLGPSVPSDVFVWSESATPNKPWLTQLGGSPWREKGKPWPKDDEGRPLLFIGQICFVDSMDLVPFELPGEIALIFGTNRGGCVSTNGGVLEWSDRDIKPKVGSSAPWDAVLPVEYHGVRHRTVQYTKRDQTERAFKAAGIEGRIAADLMATSIGSHSWLPQGWPFKEGDGRSLVATMGSLYLTGRWPLCDVPCALQRIDAEAQGTSRDSQLNSALDVGFGDAGCIWITRERDGTFSLDWTC
jgi:Domain of unknown function (DUF1963)